MFAKAGNASYRVTTPSMTPFEGKDDIKNADIRVAEHLKDLFKYDLPEPEKEEDVDSEGGRIMKDASGAMDEDEEDDGFFGVDKPDAPVNAPVKRESGASRRKSSKYDQEKEDKEPMQKTKAEPEERKSSAKVKEEEQKAAIFESDESGDDDIFWNSNQRAIKSDREF